MLALLPKRKDFISRVGANTYIYIPAACRKAFTPGENLNFGQGTLCLGSSRINSWNCKDYNQKSLPNCGLETREPRCLEASGEWTPVIQPEKTWSQWISHLSRALWSRGCLLQSLEAFVCQTGCIEFPGGASLAFLFLRWLMHKISFLINENHCHYLQCDPCQLVLIWLIERNCCLEQAIGVQVPLWNLSCDF